MVPINNLSIRPNKKIINDFKAQIIYLPLVNNDGYTYKPCVSIGSYVTIGSIVAKNQVADTNLLSSISGTVVGIEEKYLSNGLLTKCIVIENDFKDKYQDKIGKINDITKYTYEEFIYLLKKCSITDMTNNNYPTYIKYENNNKKDYLIINALDDDIYKSTNSARMYQYTEEVLDGIDAIMEINNISKCYIVIDESNELVIKKVLKHINTYPNIKIYPIPSGYPNAYDKYLTLNILDKTYDKTPQEINTIIENIETIYSIYEALKYHKPLVERMVTINGTGIKNPANYILRIGTSLPELNEKLNLYKNINNPIIIIGGLMRGLGIKSDNLIINKDIDTILLEELKETKEEKCINCGKCSEVCPVNLIPSFIIKNKKDAKKLNINKCINCGLCSYVCPSKIEIRELINKIKEDIK